MNRFFEKTYSLPFSEYKQIKYDYQVVVLSSRKGLRPTIPYNTPISLKNLITTCWANDPGERPDAKYLANFFKTNRPFDFE